MLVLLLLHDPPVAGSPNIIVLPEHTPLLPVITGGSGLTVIHKVVMQPALVA